MLTNNTLIINKYIKENIANMNINEILAAITINLLNLAKGNNEIKNAFFTVGDLIDSKDIKEEYKKILKYSIIIKEENNMLISYIKYTPLNSLNKERLLPTGFLNGIVVGGYITNTRSSLIDTFLIESNLISINKINYDIYKKKRLEFANIFFNNLPLYLHIEKKMIEQLDNSSDLNKGLLISKVLCERRDVRDYRDYLLTCRLKVGIDRYFKSIFKYITKELIGLGNSTNDIVKIIDSYLNENIDNALKVMMDNDDAIKEHIKALSYISQNPELKEFYNLIYEYNNTIMKINKGCFHSEYAYSNNWFILNCDAGNFLINFTDTNWQSSNEFIYPCSIASIAFAENLNGELKLRFGLNNLFSFSIYNKKNFIYELDSETLNKLLNIRNKLSKYKNNKYLK